MYRGSEIRGGAGSPEQPRQVINRRLRRTVKDCKEGREGAGLKNTFVLCVKSSFVSAVTGMAVCVRGWNEQVETVSIGGFPLWMDQEQGVNWEEEGITRLSCLAQEHARGEGGTPRRRCLAQAGMRTAVGAHIRSLWIEAARANSRNLSVSGVVLICSCLEVLTPQDLT